MFVQLRMTLDEEMKEYGLVKKTDLKKLWRRLDYNGNGYVSLAEIDKMVVELVAGDIWPAWLNNKPALMRAYKKTTLVDGSGGDYVRKWNFHALLLNIFWFNKIWAIFQEVDTGSDRRIDFGEFYNGLSQLGLHLNQQDAQREFNKIDNNHGGQVLFVEFCAYIRQRVNPDADANFDADIVSGEHCGETLRKKHGHKVTNEVFVIEKNFKAFDQLEDKIKKIMSNRKQLRDLWDRLDYNGNNYVSLAEIDKLVVEKFPLLNHKPALMRAYKKSDASNNSYVEKKEFKELLGNLFYFNKIFWIFDHFSEDGDRRLNFKEFKNCLFMCKCQMSEQEARREFQQVDRNGGGIVLFNEFCAWFASKNCPEMMTGLLDRSGVRTPS